MICEKCGQDLEENDFWQKKRVWKNEHPNGTWHVYYDRYPICKNCLSAKINVCREYTFLPILKELNFPYLPEYWLLNMERTDNPKTHMGKYLSRLKLCSFKYYTWEDSQNLFDIKIIKTKLNS